jgi:hypothetical protein
MEINEKVLEILTECGIRKDDGICYLISLYHNYSPTYIPTLLKQKMNLTKIVVWDDKGGLTWNLPLYAGAETAFGWVETEYVPMFKSKNPAKGGKVREATSRMKKLFSSNPEIRKEDVLGATKMYLKNTDSMFIRLPHYFLEKGVGAEKTYDVLDWIDKHKLMYANENSSRTSNSNRMQ